MVRPLDLGSSPFNPRIYLAGTDVPNLNRDICPAQFYVVLLRIFRNRVPAPFLVLDKYLILW